MTERLLVLIVAFSYMGMLVRLIQLEGRVGRLEHERRLNQ